MSLTAHMRVRHIVSAHRRRTSVSEPTDRKPLPPYVPAKTLITFLEHLHAIGGMPSHIDKDVMRSLSGGMQSWLKASLRYMKLVNDADEPTDALKRLVKAQGDDRKVLLRELFNQTYSCLNGKVDLANTTPQKLRAAFADLGAQGETVEKMISFLIGLGKVAGVPLSPYLTTRTRGPRRPKQKTAKREGATTPGSDSADDDESGDGDQDGENSAPQKAMTQALLDKFPTFDPKWPTEVQTKWFEAFSRLMTATKH